MRSSAWASKRSNSAPTSRSRSIPLTSRTGRLLQHLATEREHMFTFLDQRGVQATNWRAEQALRPRSSIARLGWKPHRSRRPHPGDRNERAAHRPPAERRPDRADGSRPTRPHPDRQQPAPDPGLASRPPTRRIADGRATIITTAKASLPSDLLRTHRRATQSDHGFHWPDPRDPSAPVRRRSSRALEESVPKSV